MSRHPLTDAYRAGRERMLELGRDLTESEGAAMTSACPLWSIKDVYAHLAGISTDILNGNTEGAATTAWADGHVADRRSKTLSEVLDEWTASGTEVSNVMEVAGDAFPMELFVDQWTHEWDVRAAIGGEASAEADNSVFAAFIDRLGRIMADEAKARGLDRLTLEVDGNRYALGEGRDLGEVSLTGFEFARICMGRRSRRQLMELDWPEGDVDGHIEVMVRWSVNEHDVHDPIILTS